MEQENSKATELLQQHQRDINCIIDDDRNLRKKGLTNILNNIFKKKTDPTIVLQLFQNNIYKNLIRSIEDKIEKNRTLSYEILDKLLDFVPGIEKQLDRDIIINIMRVMTSRLNQIPYPESSEDIRLQIVELIKKFLKYYPDEFLPILQEIALCTSKALLDQYPNLKKAAAELVMEMSDKLSQHIGHHNIGIVKSLGANLKHQHSRIRKVSIQSLKTILLTSQGGTAIEHVMPILNAIVFDHNNEVRKYSFNCISEILLGFSYANLKQYESELLSLLLNGLSDEVAEIIQETQKNLEEVGLKRKVLSLEMQEDISEFV